MAITFLSGIVLILEVVAIGYLVSQKPSPQQKFFFDLVQRNLPKQMK